MKIIHHLVGKVAYLLAKEQFKDEQEGAFFVLKQLTPEQLIGFVNSAEGDTDYYPSLTIKFPRSTMVGTIIDEKYLTDDSAVNVRNEDLDGKIVFTNDLESDVRESLSNKSAIGHEDITSSKLTAKIWADVLKTKANASLGENAEKNFEAFIKAVFKQSDIALVRIVEYLLAVIRSYEKGDPVKVSAGQQLPLLGLPLYEKCYEKVEPEHHASKWAKALEAHRKNESYLSKRDPNTNLLDEELLNKTLETQKLLDVNDPKRLDENVISQFEDYVGADGKSRETERFLFENDWEVVSKLFLNEKKTSTADFVKESRNALEHDGIQIDEEIDDFLDDLAKRRSRPAGKAPNEVKDFYSTYQNSISDYGNTRLQKAWEDYVIGKKHTCSDLFEGLIRCMKQFHKDLTGKENLYLQIGALRQSKINDFKGIDRKVCIYFEKYYGDIENFFKGKIQLSNKADEKSLLFSYTDKVFAEDQSVHNAKKTSNSTKNNKGFEFRIALMEKSKSDDSQDDRLATVNLIWQFKKASVLEKEQEDMESILKAKRPLIVCKGAYETIGKKGAPLPLNLNDIRSFDGAPGAKGAGSFVPSQVKIKVITIQIERFLQEELDKGNIGEGIKNELLTKLSVFEESYNNALAAFSLNRISANLEISTMSQEYRNLLEYLYHFNNESIRKRCTKLLLSAGTVEVSEDNGRPPVVVLCPWHPVRMEALNARFLQIQHGMLNLLKDDGATFSDGAAGALFFDDLTESCAGKLIPEVSLTWKGMDANGVFHTSHLGGYSIHTPLNFNGCRNSIDDTAEDAKIIVDELTEYLRLQPHERDNLSVVLYNCGSQSLPQLIVSKLGKENEKAEKKKQTPMNCEVILTHQKQKSLQDVYKSLIFLHGSEDEREGATDFLSKIRINISAIQDFSHRSPKGQTPATDLVYCKDLLSSKSTLAWSRVKIITCSSRNLHAHRWNRSLPHKQGDTSSKALLCCPAQTKTGWAFLQTLGKLCSSESAQWDQSEALLPTKSLDFDNHEVSEILNNSHKLGVWVVNRDEMLDKRLLEDKQINVIRYIQSISHGRNLVISSTAQDTLLRVTLNERLQQMTNGASEEEISKLTNLFINEANAITGGLVLKAARRANNTSELLGMVLSKFLVQSELDTERPVCWCSLDDYSRWLGKASGDLLADLLVLSPDYRDGEPHLDIIVTEAKYVTQDNLTESKKRSAKQLKDTLLQISRALSEPAPADQELWLSRLSDLVLSRMTGTKGRANFSAEKWRSIVRNRECSFAIQGYSHVFVHHDNNNLTSVCPGIGITGHADVKASQEIFNKEDTNTLANLFNSGKYEEAKKLRLQIGHPGFTPMEGRFLSIPKPFDIEIPNDPKVPSRIAVPSSDSGEEQASENTSAKDENEQGESSDSDSKESHSHENNSDAEEQEEGSVDSKLLAILKKATDEVATEETDQKWLSVIVEKLKTALRDKNMSSKLDVNHPPVLTPNAAIITFEGSAHISVARIQKEESEFLTTYGIEILQLRPGSGVIAVTVKRPHRRMLHTAQVLYDFFNSKEFKPHSEQVIVGVREMDAKIQLLDPDGNPHSLVAGKTGSGKSVLLQLMAIYIALTRPPEDTHIYIVDGKSGLDYYGMKDLPHIKQGHGSIIIEKDESKVVLEELVAEMDRRYKLFQKSGSKNINAYRKKTGENLPTIFYFQDEFAEWMLDSDYANDITASINSLGIKSRAAGIFMIFGLQRPDNTVMPMQLRSQLGNRLTLQVTDKGTAEIATGEKNSRAEKLLNHGHMLAKLEDVMIPIQVPFTDEDLMEQLVQYLIKKYSP